MGLSVWVCLVCPKTMYSYMSGCWILTDKFILMHSTLDWTETHQALWCHIMCFDDARFLSDSRASCCILIIVSLPQCLSISYAGKMGNIWVFTPETLSDYADCYWVNYWCIWAFWYVQEMRPELAYLAHRCSELDKYRVETCCIIGELKSGEIDLNGSHFSK